MLILALLVLFGVAAALARLLRATGVSGAALLGGAAAGLLLGPTIAGRVAPRLHEETWNGGIELRQQRDELVRLHAADMAAARYAGLERGELDAISAGQREELAPLEAQLRDATWTHQRPLRVAVALVVAAALLSAGPLGARRAGHRHGAAAPLSIGAWAALLPGGLLYLLLREGLDVDVAPALLAAAAIGIGPFVLAPVDRASADEAELSGARLTEKSGMVSSLLAIAGAATAMALLRPAALAWGAALLALPLGWLLPARAPRQLGTVVEMLLLPALAALAAVAIDLPAHAAFWPLLAALLLSGDGRWFGAVIGALLPGGRRPLRTMRLVLGAMACGPTQMAVVAIGLHTWTLTPPLGLALAAGALLIAATAPMRRWAAAQLVEMEEPG